MTMRLNWRTVKIWACIPVLLSLSSIAFADAENVRMTGMITARTGDSMAVRVKSATETVILDDSTRVQRPSTMSFSKTDMSASVLIPGLKVKVEGTRNSQNQIVAKSITFDAADLEMAEMIQAGLHPTAQQVAANLQQIRANQGAIAQNQNEIASNQRATSRNAQNIASNKKSIEHNIQDVENVQERFSKLADYEEKGKVVLRFAPSSSQISPENGAQLTQLAQEARSYTGYLIEVKGFADTSGNASVNQKLSEDRAQSAIAYLIQNGNVPVRHIIAPGAMGITAPVSSNETAEGRAENRRVEITILVNRGLSDGK